MTNTTKTLRAPLVVLSVECSLTGQSAFERIPSADGLRIVRISRTAIRARRLGAVAGMLARFAPESWSWARCREDFETEVVFGLPRTSESADAFSDAWFTAWERGQAREGRIPAHLTAPAARARA